MARAVVLAGLTLLALTGSAFAGKTRPPSCNAAKLGGVFAVVNGSGGAGSISYDLRLRNRLKTSCTVLGVPGLRLLGRTGTPLPTKVIPDESLAAHAVALQPGAYAAATARFTPTVPGPGEPQTRQCEPSAYKVRVSAYAGSLTVPVAPPTPICLHGRIFLTPLIAGRHGPRS